jgi:nicotinate-nucleotide adenylyltransferase
MWLNFDEWKEADWILENYKVLVYRRQVDIEKTHDARLTTFDLPMFDISSTNIRNRIRTNQAISFFVTQNVEQYITFHKLYQ